MFLIEFRKKVLWDAQDPRKALAEQVLKHVPATEEESYAGFGLSLK
ncbi:MAG: hypothetical protein OXT73_11075 [Bacteroidota bacterium]|nr:hypothetical protein [Bacteroidota bacterium]